MLFNSYEFIFLFLPTTFFIYFFLNSRGLVEASKAFLVFASLFFYSWWNIIYLPLILTSLLFNYTVGKILCKEKILKNINKKAILAIGILVNISLLGYYKYSDFFITNINTLIDTDIKLLRLALPLAISFFTFQQIAYLVDSYRSETREYRFLNYALFVTFFPQLIAGPIVHHKEMMPQFTKIKNQVKNYKNISIGLFIFTIGLFKKVVIADTFSIWVNTGFDNSTTLTFFEAWATSLSYTFQLYFDFSGYTDMAIGAAMLFNINLPINFDSPYKSLNIQEFWRRWHITLSRFLKDYIYIPLGGNRRSMFRTYYNIMATFILAGLWHGAGWTFIFWGSLHGVALVMHRIWKRVGFELNRHLAWFITFNFINIAWIFFRAKDWGDSIKILKGMFGMGGIMLSDKTLYKLDFLKDFIASHPENFGRLHFGTSTFVWSIVGIYVVAKLKNSYQISQEFQTNYKNLIFIFAVAIYTLFDMNKISEFLYFNF